MVAAWLQQKVTAQHEMVQKEVIAWGGGVASILLLGSRYILETAQHKNIRLRYSELLGFPGARLHYMDT